MAVAPSYSMLLLALALGGVANSLAQIGTNGTLAQVVPRHRRGLAFGVKQAAIPAATLLAGFALPVVGLTLGWRASFAAAAGLAVFYIAFVPRPTQRTRAAASSGGRDGDAAVRALVVVAVAAEPRRAAMLTPARPAARAPRSGRRCG